MPVSSGVVWGAAVRRPAQFGSASTPVDGFLIAPQHDWAGGAAETQPLDFGRWEPHAGAHRELHGEKEGGQYR